MESEVAQSELALWFSCLLLLLLLRCTIVVIIELRALPGKQTLLFASSSNLAGLLAK